ncbi:MAG: SctF chaperone SctG [Chlamydiia bacterium]|nr:SctF chaperone SctG [Chlamydiia bacterium]
MEQKDQSNPFDEDFVLFIEAGFLAIRQLDESSAKRLFFAAQELRPESVVPEIGFGYIALNKLEVKEAREIFEGVLKKEPTNQVAQSFLAIALLLTKSKREEGKEMINEILAKTEDETVHQLSEVALKWCEKDLERKDRHPFALKNSEKKKDES